jgi:hypothetical protein
MIDVARPIKKTSVKIGSDIYEEIPPQSILASRWLVEIWERLGKPATPLTESGEKLMKVIIAVWEDLYPREAHDWYEERKEYRLHEMSTKEQVLKQTGRSLASFPLPVFRMMHKLFPTFSLGKRNTVIKLVAKFPMFQMCKKV